MSRLAVAGTESLWLSMLRVHYPCAKLLRLPERAVSVSMDADSIADYLNFAPSGFSLASDNWTFPVFARNVLHVLSDLELPATMFCIADRMSSPDVLAFYKDAIAAGHRIGNHSLTHPDFAGLSESERAAEVRSAHKRIADLLGVECKGFRAPVYYISEAVLETLAELKYDYDSSATNSRLSEALIYVYSLLNRNFKARAYSPLHRQFKRNRLAVVHMAAGSIFEWPIPTAAGLTYYGTFHCIAPSAVFRVQTTMLANLRHIHYELHPIETLHQDAIKEYPFLPTANGNATRDWLAHRLTRLSRGRTPTTLEDLSAANRNLLH
jgi:peptidoglycan/xylan/chitin deacetylase (PgdA/CDA1 family)